MGNENPVQRSALTELVRASVGVGRRWSLREFAARAVDPATGWSPSKSLLAKIVNDEPFKAESRLVSALAVGLDAPRSVVAAAAHWQVIGYDPEELTESAPTVLLRHLSAVGREAPLAAATVRRWDAEEETDG